MESGSGTRPLLLGLAVIVVVGALVGLFLWLDTPDAPPPVETVDRLPSVPAPPAPLKPDGGGFRPHPDRAGLRPITPPDP